MVGTERGARGDGLGVDVVGMLVGRRMVSFGRAVVVTVSEFPCDIKLEELELSSFFAREGRGRIGRSSCVLMVFTSRGFGDA